MELFYLKYHKLFSELQEPEDGHHGQREVARRLCHPVDEVLDRVAHLSVRLGPVHDARSQVVARAAPRSPRLFGRARSE